MIPYKEFQLENGLHVLVHEDPTTPLAVMNILYDVGSKDEKEDKTGFAHLFEHLMFGGSMHIASYDEPLQKVGGENNAFTTCDLTNYYLSLPAVNIETGFWLESDRMLSLSFNPEVLEVQKKVVIEEYKQRYLNQPYGDAWLHLRPLAYQAHPYQWPTIGKDISHIEKASIEDVREFFFKYYVPNNAYLVVAGNVTEDNVRGLSEKWFGTIEHGPKNIRRLNAEPPQKEKRIKDIEADVPLNAIYKAFHMPARGDRKYYVADLISDILGRSKSSRLYQKLVRDREYFSEIDAYILGSIEPGLLIIQGNINNDVSPDEAEGAINEILQEICEYKLPEKELEKIKNQAESQRVYGEVELLNRAMHLAFGALLGDPNMYSKEIEIIQSIKPDEILQVSKEILTNQNSSVLRYLKKRKS